jgi:hypothetical protein
MGSTINWKTNGFAPNTKYNAHIAVDMTIKDISPPKKDG